MDRRSFLGAAAAALLPLPAFASGAARPRPPLDAFEPVDWGKPEIRIPFDLTGRRPLAAQEIVTAHAATVYRHTPAFPGDHATVVLLTRVGRGDTAVEAVAALRRQLEYEATLLAHVAGGPGRRKLWLRQPGGFSVFRSPKGDWVAHSRDRLVVVPEYS